VTPIMCKDGSIVNNLIGSVHRSFDQYASSNAGQMRLIIDG